MDAFCEEEVEGETRIVLKLNPKIAPVKVAVLPLIKKEELISVSRDIQTSLKLIGAIVYDETASIGKRYRKQDEIGTPYCITVDFDSLEDKKVTVRDRDTMKQDRVEISKLLEFLSPKFQ
jgi:glycyl-tRNA synthetase